MAIPPPPARTTTFVHSPPYTSIKYYHTHKRLRHVPAFSSQHDSPDHTPLPSRPWHHSIAATTAAAAAAAAFFAFYPVTTPPPSNAVTNEQLLFLEAWRAVDRAYVDKKFNGQNWFKIREDSLKTLPMSSRQDTYAAIKTLLASLDDPFTRFLDPDQYNALKRSTSGAVTGIGVEVSFSQGKGAASPLIVISPAPGGPADRAGIKPQDEILDIDGQPTSDLSLYAAGNMLQGAEGTQVSLRIKSHRDKTVKDLTLTRQPIIIDPVDVMLCPSSGGYAPSAAPTSKLGYIRIATFSKQTAEKTRDAITTLKSSGADRLVLDIRNNGGGLFPAGVEVGRMLIDKGDIVLIADAEGVRDIYEADGSAIDASTPLAVLVNRGTASASEVLAGALKDDHRGTIVGESTFGKGLIQTLIQLSDGSAVAVTVAKYQTPAGIDINKVGISPDVVVDGEELLSLPMNGNAFCEYGNGGDRTPPKLFG